MTDFNSGEYLYRLSAQRLLSSPDGNSLLTASLVSISGTFLPSFSVLGPARLVTMCYCLGETVQISNEYVTSDSQSASLSWCQAPSETTTRFLLLSVRRVLIWAAFCDERTDLSFTVAACPRHRSHSRVRVPRDSLPYLTVSDSIRDSPNLEGQVPVFICPKNRLSQVYHQASYDSNPPPTDWLKLKLNYDWQSVGQSVLVTGAHLGPTTNFSFSLKFALDSCEFVIL
jgi:hypothetical protein